MIKLFSFAEAYLLLNPSHELDVPQRPPNWSKQILNWDWADLVGCCVHLPFFGLHGGSRTCVERRAERV